MTYKYKTDDFLAAINKMVADDQLDEAINEFYSAIPQRDALRAAMEAVNLKGQLSDYRKKERLNIGAEWDHLNKIRVSFTELLYEFRKQHPRSAPLKKTSFIIRNGLQPVNEESSSKKTQIKPPIDPKRPLWDWRGTLIIILIVACSGYIGVNSWVRNIRSNRILLPEGPCWVVYLNTFSDLGKAQREASQYPLRKISTLQMQNIDGFVNVMMPESLYSSSEAESLLTRSVAQKWTEAKIIDLKEYCSGKKLKKDKLRGIWVCK